MLSPTYLPMPWQIETWSLFNQRISEQRLPHALMINALEGIGAEILAKAMAYRLLCLNVEEGKPCGRCKACQLMQAGTHPDFFEIEPEEQGKPIKIDQIRQLCANVAKTSQQGGWKVVVIKPAEAMNIAAANALLKSLEEPEANTLMILVAHRISRVPTTVRSRCQIESLVVPSRDMALNWLVDNNTADDIDLNEVLSIANGQPILALDYIQSGGLENLKHVESLLERLRQSSESPLAAAQACQKYRPEDVITWMLGYVHRLMIGELKSSPNPALFDFTDKLMAARSWFLSSSTINTQLLWEELFIQWTQIFQTRK
jgi:DNA polymerase-3 subunit delta'